MYAGATDIPTLVIDHARGFLHFPRIFCALKPLCGFFIGHNRQQSSHNGKYKQGLYTARYINPAGTAAGFGCDTLVNIV
jgi:hypothetical protein